MCIQSRCLNAIGKCNKRLRLLNFNQQNPKNQPSLKSIVISVIKEKLGNKICRIQNSLISHTYKLKNLSLNKIKQKSKQKTFNLKPQKKIVCYQKVIFVKFLQWASDFLLQGIESASFGLELLLNLCFLLYFLIVFQGKILSISRAQKYSIISSYINGELHYKINE